MWWHSCWNAQSLPGLKPHEVTGSSSRPLKCCQSTGPLHLKHRRLFESVALHWANFTVSWNVQSLPVPSCPMCPRSLHSPVCTAPPLITSWWITFAWTFYIVSESLVTLMIWLYTLTAQDVSWIPVVCTNFLWLITHICSLCKASCWRTDPVVSWTALWIYIYIYIFKDVHVLLLRPKPSSE